jgi:drug/metabolite transporter (DMT)-like permease
MSETRQWLGFWLSLSTAVLWGALPVALELLLGVLDVVTISWARFAFSTLVVCAWLWRRGQLPGRALFDLRFSTVLVIAIAALLGNFLLYLVGLALLNPESTQVLIQLAPFLLMFGSVWFYGERLGAVEWSGALILCVGFGLFFNEKLALLFSELSSYTLGVVAMLAAALSWSVYGLLQKVLLRRASSLQLTLLIYLGGTLALGAFSAPGALLQLTLTQALALLFCCLNMVLGYGAFTEALRVWQAAKVSAVIALAPVFTIVCMALAVRVAPQRFSPSELNLWSYLGAFMVVAGSMLAAIGRSR